MPNIQTVKKVANFFNVPVEMLIDYDDYIMRDAINQLSLSSIEVDFSSIEGESLESKTVLVWPCGHPEEKVRVKLTQVRYALCAGVVDSVIAKTVRIRKELNLRPVELVTTVVDNVEISPSLLSGMVVQQSQ